MEQIASKGTSRPWHNTKSQCGIVCIFMHAHTHTTNTPVPHLSRLLHNPQGAGVRTTRPRALTPHTSSRLRLRAGTTALPQVKNRTSPSFPSSLPPLPMQRRSRLLPFGGVEEEGAQLPCTLPAPPWLVARAAATPASRSLAHITWTHAL